MECILICLIRSRLPYGLEMPFKVLAWSEEIVLILQANKWRRGEDVRDEVSGKFQYCL